MPAKYVPPGRRAGPGGDAAPAEATNDARFESGGRWNTPLPQSMPMNSGYGYNQGQNRYVHLASFVSFNGSSL